MKTIIFFARTPEAGRGKIRLRKYVRSSDVDRIARHLYDDMFETLSLADGELVIYYEGKVPQKDAPAKPQCGEDLGERMARALREELQDGPAVLLGSDLIGVDPHYIAEAFRALTRGDIVLGPALDGGYGLIGMNRFIDVFSGIAYSQSDVLDKTRAKAENLGQTVSLLPAIRDIDVIDDLAAEVLQSPVVDSKVENSDMLFTAENGVTLRVLNEKPSQDVAGGLREPTIMMPFFHYLLEP
ncbi:MAG: TIGR04282 family arsenosugar biosynthesis glycosyltransferase [Peptoniphilus sp.]|nr:TIGR04282 family arsenosugar biosynthesis glycosyltransferase [Peptoniphilus sp.]MDD7362560.1 TIGR04282 family arsenosugar biosynthesis glycosyltransferase [Bacillota bacterium]MDY6045041.1 TIGR04282 family arsenosugar biosynthesis glycosyltransferase [Peptoniphilus sp.]